MKIPLMISGLPFDDFRQLLAALPGPNIGARDEAAEVNRRAEARDGSLGTAADIAEWLASWAGKRPGLLKPQIGLFAGTHGISKQMPDASQHEVQDFVDRCGAGGAAINQLCAAGDYGLKVFDLALDMPTADMTNDAALDERGCAATMAFGMEALAGGTDIVVLAGQGGHAGRISAATVLMALLGTPISDEPIAVAALKHHAGHLGDPLEVLRRVGGREIAALAGAIVAARTQHVPVILDGIAAIAAAAAVRKLEAAGIDHCRVADSGSGFQAQVLTAMGIEPILSLGMASGDGSAGAIAAGVVQAAAHCHAANGARETRH